MKPFSFNNLIYKQRDGVSTGSSLGPILANITMTELEKKILQPLRESGELKFYMKHVDDTLLLAKEDDIKDVFDKFNSLHQNLKFIKNCFEDNNVHFFNITIDKMYTDLCYKLMHAGQSDFDRILPWNYKIALLPQNEIKTKKCKPQIYKIKLFIPWNGYPLRTCNAFTKRLRNGIKTKRNDDIKSGKKIIWVALPYLGHIGDKMKKRYFKKVQKCMAKKVYFFTSYETEKLAIFALLKTFFPYSKNQILLVA